MSMHYLKLQDAMKKAYCFLWQRHDVKPEEFKTPGKFVSLSMRSSRLLAQGPFPPEMLDQQEENWNVLMNVKKVDEDGNETFGETVFDMLADLLEQETPTHRHCLCNHEGELETEWVLDLGEKNKDTNLTTDDQHEIEANRSRLVKEMDGKLFFPLPCTCKAEWKRPADGAMTIIGCSY